VADDRQLLDLIDLAYESALEPSGWPRFLEAFAQMVHGTATVVTVDDLGQRQASIALAVQVDAAAIRTYETEFVGKNVWQNEGRHLFKPGVVVTGEMTCSRATFLRSEYYNDFLQRIGIFHGLGAVLAPEPGSLGFLASFRPPSEGQFDAATLELVTRLLPHVQRALQLHRRAGHLAWKSAATLASVDQLGVAFMAVDATSRILVANALAERLLDGGGLGSHHGRLHASTRGDTQRLRHAVARAADRTLGARSAGAVIQVRRESGAPLTMLVSPLPTDHVLDRFGQTSTVALFVTDPDAAQPDAAPWLEAAYQLTPAEARLLLALVAGASLSQAAEQCAITINTARWHMKHVASKMGVSRQSQAVAKALRELPTLRAGLP